MYHGVTWTTRALRAWRHLDSAGRVALRATSGRPTGLGSLAAVGHPVARARPLGLRYTASCQRCSPAILSDDGSPREPRGPLPTASQPSAPRSPCGTVGAPLIERATIGS